MSLIRCTQNCVYQDDGCCTLESAPDNDWKAVPNDYCVNFTPRPPAVRSAPPAPDEYF